MKDPNGKFNYGDLFGSRSMSREWKEMILPSNWQLAGVKDYSGVIWFRRHFMVSQEFSGPEHWLRFNGVDYTTEVWLNGRYLGSHEGYFGPFEFNVTGLLKLGSENSLVVRVDSPQEEPGTVWPDRKRLIKGIFSHHDARPGSCDFRYGQSQNTGGIWNSVLIYGSGKVKIDLIKTSPKLLKDGSAVVIVEIEVQNLWGQDRFVSIELQISPANFPSPQILQVTKDVHLSRGGNRLNFIFHIAEPRLWWTWDHGEQNLYFLEVKVNDEGEVVDFQRVRFGIREIKVDESGIWYLNHKRIFLRGSNIIPTQWLSEYDREAVERDVALIKEANLNAIRVHAHVNREEFYALCDEAGVLVWQDFALQWSYEESSQFMEKAVGQIKKMVRMLYNHPSICAWCCHNEPSVNRHTLDSVLYRAVSEEDQTRYVSEASDFTEHAYPGWYEEDYVQFKALPGAPLVTEFGAQALPNLEAMKEILDPEDLWPPHWERWAYHNFQYDQTFNVAGIEKGKSIEEFIHNSQSYQYDLLKYAIETYRRARYNPISGLFQFMFVDCWPAITWSVLDYYRRPKAGFEALRLACQPLLPSIGLPRRKLVPGMKIFHAIYVINDLHRDFQGVNLRISLEDSKERQLMAIERKLDIPPDSLEIVVQTELGEKEWLVPQDCRAGEYWIKVTLYSSQGELLSLNKERIWVEKLPGGLAEPSDSLIS